MKNLLLSDKKILILFFCLFISNSSLFAQNKKLIDTIIVNNKEYYGKYIFQDENFIYFKTLTQTNEFKEWKIPKNTVNYYSNNKIKDKDPITIFRISLLYPKILIEQKTSYNISLVLSLYPSINPNYNYTMRNIKLFSPITKIEPRYYTTLRKRILLKKDINYLSSGYVGFPIRVALFYPLFSVGTVYGFQQNIGKNGYFNFSLGAVYEIYDNESYFSPSIDLGLGFFLN